MLCAIGEIGSKVTSVLNLFSSLDSLSHHQLDNNRSYAVARNVIPSASPFVKLRKHLRTGLSDQREYPKGIITKNPSKLGLLTKILGIFRRVAPQNDMNCVSPKQV